MTRLTALRRHPVVTGLAVVVLVLVVLSFVLPFVGSDHGGISPTP